MADTVAVTIEYKVEDFVLAARWVVARNPRTYFICGVLALGFLLIGLPVWLYSSDQAMGQAIMIGSVAGGLLAYPAMIFAVGGHARKSFESNPAFKHEFHWLLSPTELSIKGKGISAELELANYQRAAETKQGFMFWQSAAVYNYLPKRALPDKETVERVRAIIRKGLPGTAKIQLRDD